MCCHDFNRIVIKRSVEYILNGKVSLRSQQFRHKLIILHHVNGNLGKYSAGSQLSFVLKLAVKSPKREVIFPIC